MKMALWGVQTFEFYSLIILTVAGRKLERNNILKVYVKRLFQAQLENINFFVQIVIGLRHLSSESLDLCTKWRDSRDFTQFGF